MTILQYFPPISDAFVSKGYFSALCIMQNSLFHVNKQNIFVTLIKCAQIKVIDRSYQVLYALSFQLLIFHSVSLFKFLLPSKDVNFNNRVILVLSILLG